MSENSTSKTAFISYTQSVEEPDKLDDFSSQHFLTSKEIAPPKTIFKDMDNDGDKDIVVIKPGSSYWIENTMGTDAHAVFEHSIFKHIIPTAMGFGDVDGDTTKDVVIGHSSGAKIFHNDGDWSLRSIDAAMHAPTAILVEDITNDGAPDILIQDQRELTLFQNVDGAFGIMSMSWPAVTSASIIKVGNFDITNSTLEILIQGVNDSEIKLISHDGKTWLPPKVVDSIVTETLTMADLNHDGMQDIALVDEDGNQVLLEGDGTGAIINHAIDTLSDLDDEEADLSAEEMPPPQADILTISPSNIAEDGELNTILGWGGTYNDDYDDASADYTYDGPSQVINWDEPEFSTVEDWQATMDFSYSELAIDLDWNVEQTAEESHLHMECGAAWSDGTQWSDVSMVVNVIGSGGDDFIALNGEGNYIDGGDGNDELHGGDGDDTIMGGQGLDAIFGDIGNDILSGMEGTDVIFGGIGLDSIYGGWGQDILFGNRGNDQISGGVDDDVLFGGEGDDAIYGGEGYDTLYGDSGHDTFYFQTVVEGFDEIKDFCIMEDQLKFAFGDDNTNFFTVEEAYSGAHETNDGDAFVWEKTGEYSGKLYYDEDTSTTGNEWLIADVDTTEEDGTMTMDAIIIL